MIAVVLLSSLLSGQTAVAACVDVSACREAALQAAQKGDYETFHDLAWRAIQKGRQNDPELMLMLARAQSLSGRPGDALVMLRRLAQLGVAADVDTEDFRRVRSLPGWAELEQLLAAVREKRSRTVEEVEAPRSAGTPKASTDPVRAPKPSNTTAPPPAPAPVAARRDTAVRAAGEDAIRIPASSMEPIGLAYDSASRRFVLGDRHENKVIVADEVFKRVNDLIGAGSGGFGTLSAIEIDRTRGDLWVTSAAPDGSVSVHKLQLVSGRVLTRMELPGELGQVLISDIALSDSGALLLVDAAAGRLLALAPSARGFARPVDLGVAVPRSIAPAGPVTYVAHERGLLAVDLNSGLVSHVRASKELGVTGLQRIRWHRGSLVAIQATGDTGASRLVRIRLGPSGRSVSAIEVLDEHDAIEGAALTLSGRDAYYLARSAEGPIIRRVSLR